MTDRPDNASDRRHAEPAGADPVRVVLALLGLIGALAVLAINMGE